MSGIWGLISFSGAPLEAGEIQAMSSAMASWGPNGCRVWHDGRALLGHGLLWNTPEALTEVQPVVFTQPGVVVTSAARLDNRGELCAALGLPQFDSSPAVSDGELIARAYVKWGRDAVGRLIGDWSFAAWNVRERSLFVARDHLGISALYYAQFPGGFAFASDRRALLALGRVRRDVDLLYVAQLLVASPEYFGERTAFSSIRRLPPGHRLGVDATNLCVDEYWCPSRQPALQLANPRDYADALLDVVQSAVSARLRSHRAIAATLSGGLDSSAITALAAKGLLAAGEPLVALTAAPSFTCERSVPRGRFGDEWRLAQLVAGRWSNIRHLAVRSPRDPVQSVCEAVALQAEPVHAAGSQYWLRHMLSTAQELGIGSLLTGEMGNATFSWSGSGSRPWWHWRRTLRHAVGLIRRSVRDAVQPQGDDAALGPELRNALLKAGRPASGTYDIRSASGVGRNISGGIAATSAASFGLEIRDPFADPRVVEFAFRVPDEIWGLPPGRWLARTAGAGLLPDPIRLNRARGLQSADVIYQLRAHRGSLIQYLNRPEWSRGLSSFVDVGVLRRVAESVESEEDVATAIRARQILLRGIGVAEFLSIRW